MTVLSVTPGIQAGGVSAGTVQGHPMWDGAGGDCSTTFLTNIRRFACRPRSSTSCSPHIYSDKLLTEYLLE